VWLSRGIDPRGREDEETDTLPMAAGSCKSANWIISPFAVLVLEAAAGVV